MKKEGFHPLIKHTRTFGEKASDNLSKILGSWSFIILFICFIAIWMTTEGYFLLKIVNGELKDPFPFILLNLTLSCLAALQAPIILMSQNRQAKKDRLHAEYDYQVNRKAEKEIEELKIQLDRIERKISK
ncbi:MAG: DUF1003 domain-containing protein [Candidatus Pacearchaeota archaeon]|jgi:uncharacterized membrane protein